MNASMESDIVIWTLDADVQYLITSCASKWYLCKFLGRFIYMWIIVSDWQALKAEEHKGFLFDKEDDSVLYLNVSALKCMYDIQPNAYLLTCIKSFLKLNYHKSSSRSLQWTN